MSAAESKRKRKLRELPPPDVYDPVIEVYMRDVDRTLLRENLKLTPAKRAEKFLRFIKQITEIRGTANRRAKVGPE